MSTLAGGLTLLACLAVARSADEHIDGLPGCQCLGEIPSKIPQFDCDVAWADEGTCVTVSDSYGAPGYTPVYSSTYGEACTAHAEPKLSECFTAEGAPLPEGEQAGWCGDAWCYVDPCYCDQADVAPSSAFPGQLYYSYATCGSIDQWTASHTNHTNGSAGCDEDKNKTDDRDACVDPLSGGAYEMHLPYAAHNQTIVVPEVPTDAAAYSYATDRAMVAVPAECAEKFHLAGNFIDRPPEGPTGMYYMRVSDPAAEYARLAEMGASGCACGLVLLIHGTTGARWQSVSYAAMTSGMGYVTVIPDSHAMPDEMGLKGAKALKETGELDLTNYCGAMDAYASRCDSWGKASPKPFCYSTKVENILHNRTNYKRFVERNYLIRKLEIDYFVESQQHLINSFGKVFLLGRSEGGMAAGRYFHPALFPRLTGMILSGASCEYNYFSSCPGNAVICEGRCSKALPVLNINGDLDNYFGATGSVSEIVSGSVNGYGASPITGNCNAAFQAQGFRFGTTVYFPPAKHSIMYTHDNAVRSVFADFMAHPKTPSEWHSLERDGCTWENGIYECDDMSGPTGESPCVSWKVNPNASWIFMGSDQQCPMTCADVKRQYKANGCCGSPFKAFSM